MKAMDESGSDTVVWRASEYPFKRKGSEWYSSVIIIALSVAIAIFMLGNLTLSILIVVATFALLLLASRPPQKITVALTQKGVVIGSRRYPYRNIESFYVNEATDPARLYLKSKKFFSPLIVIEIVGVENEAVHTYLYQHLDEEELYESVFQKAMEYMGF